MAKNSGVDGSRWAFMKKFNIPDASNPGRTYLARLRVLQTPLGGIYFHKIFTNDGDRDLHNHPYTFYALILKGGYSEVRQPSLDAAIFVAHDPVSATKYTWKRGSLHKVSYKDFHSIRTLHGNPPAWTLLFVGRRRQNWGFATKDGFVPYQDYVKLTSA